MVRVMMEKLAMSSLEGKIYATCSFQVNWVFDDPILSFLGI